jgi:glycosyltransferase involved in cell wall biosynthesis
MKILHSVQRYDPDVGGSEEVVKQLSEHLVAYGHEVVVATGASERRTSLEINGVRIEEFHCSGNAVEGMRGEVDRYRDFLRGFDADVMMNYAAQIWSTDLVFDLLPSLRMKKVFVPCGYSRLADPLFGSYFAALPEVLRSYDSVVYLSDNYQDARFAREHRLDNGIMIPNAASETEFSTPRKGAFRSKHALGDARLVLNVSNHSTLKNHSFFWRCLGKLHEYPLKPVLIGNAYTDGFRKWLSQCYAQCHLAALRSGALLMEDAPRADVVDAYADADVFLFGSKVECSPLVMFESFASRTLFVTTDCGNVRDYEEIACIVKDEEEAAAVLRDFFSHPEKYRDRVERGHALFLNSLNWDVIARRYESLYRGLLSR